MFIPILIQRKCPPRTNSAGKEQKNKGFRGQITTSEAFLTLFSGTPESMTEAVHTLMERCKAYPNFVLSSGCDIPPDAKWNNIRAFFAAAAEQK